VNLPKGPVVYPLLDMIPFLENRAIKLPYYDILFAIVIGPYTSDGIKE
jgi:hypothetical protein